MMNNRGLMWHLNYYRDKIKSAAVIDSRQLYALWEQHQLRRLFQYLNIDCVFDIGANEGQYGKMLRRKAGYAGYILSFEPIPEVAAVLRSASAGDPKWIVIESAIAEDEGTREFHVMRESQFSSFGNPKHTDVSMFVSRNVVQQTIEVKTVRLATALHRAQDE